MAITTLTLTLATLRKRMELVVITVEKAIINSFVELFFHQRTDFGQERCQRHLYMGSDWRNQYMRACLTCASLGMEPTCS